MFPHPFWGGRHKTARHRLTDTPSILSPFTAATTTRQQRGLTMPKHLVIACGGTGGHFYPTLAVARLFAVDDSRVTLLLAGKHVDEQARTAAQYGLDSVALPAVRLPGNALETLLFLPRLAACTLKARSALRRLQPDIMLGMGSFAAVPACLALPRRIPLVLHEGNAYMGKTNRLFIHRAAAIGLTLPLADPRQSRSTTAVTVGMPLRQALLDAVGTPPDPAFPASLGLLPDRLTVLVFGGSQGARFINELFARTAPTLPAASASRLQFIHLTGTDDNQALLQAYQQAGIPASIRRADNNIEACYAAADLVVCRAGASSICELALFGKPAMLIPLPTAADNHQTVNAELLQRADAAVHFPQQQATPAALASQLADRLAQPEAWLQRGRNLHAFARPNAAADLVQLLHHTLENRRRPAPSTPRAGR